MGYGFLVIVFDDIENRRNLPGAHTGVETVVAVPGETDILIRAVQITLVVQDLCQLQQ